MLYPGMLLGFETFLIALKNHNKNCFISTIYFSYKQFSLQILTSTKNIVTCCYSAIDNWGPKRS